MADTGSWGWRAVYSHTAAVVHGYFQSGGRWGRAALEKESTLQRWRWWRRRWWQWQQYDRLKFFFFFFVADYSKVETRTKTMTGHEKKEKKRYDSLPSSRTMP